jgi:hypothetical protein
LTDKVVIVSIVAIVVIYSIVAIVSIDDWLQNQKKVAQMQYCDVFLNYLEVFLLLSKNSKPL